LESAASNVEDKNRVSEKTEKDIETEDETIKVVRKRWYVVNTYSGHENKVKNNLLTRTKSLGIENRIFQVEIPEEKVMEIKVLLNILSLSS